MTTLLSRLKTFLSITIPILLISPGSGYASGKQSLAILPLRLNAPPGMEYLKGAYRDVITARLSAGDGIMIEEQSKLQAAEKDGSELTEETKKALAGKTGVAYLLDGSLSVIGDDLSLDVRLIKADSWTASPMTYKGKGLGAFSEMLEKVAAESRVIILGAVPARTVSEKAPAAKEKTWKSQRLPVALKGIGVADLDGDGTRELAAIDDKSLYIYSMDKDGLKLKKEIKGTGPTWNYSIAVGDFNGNGFPEIYISRKYAEKAAARVMEFNGKELAVIADELPWFIRTVKGSGKPLLIGAKFRHIDGLYGGIKNLVWKNGVMEEGEPLDIPRTMGMYGFTFCDATGDGKDDLVSLSDTDRLGVYEREDGVWKQTWKSTGYYGGSNNNIEYGPAGPEQKSVNVKAEVFCGMAVEDGKREIIVNSNDASSRIFKTPSYESGDVRGLLWNELGMEDKWRSKKVNGYLADHTVTDLEKDEVTALVVTKQPSFLSSGESLIVTLTPEINLQLK